MKHLTTTLTTLAATAVASVAATLALAGPASAQVPPPDRPTLKPVYVKGLFDTYTRAGVECAGTVADTYCAYHPARHGGVGSRYVVFNGWVYYL